MNQARLEVIDEVFAANLIDHADEQSELSGPESIKQFILEMRATFPDLEVSVESIIGEGNQVASRESWQGTHRRTGQRVNGTVLHWFVFDGPHVIEEWSAGWEWLNEIELTHSS